jgi:hypothetical protein
MYVISLSWLLLQSSFALRLKLICGIKTMTGLLKWLLNKSITPQNNLPFFARLRYVNDPLVR